MTFDQLLADAPRQTAEQWAARAAKEWRGRAPEDFAVALGAGASVPPFVSTDDRRVALPRPQRGQWKLLSDLRALGPAITAADALTELEGGAQGLALTAEQLPRLRAGGEDIRYDFLTLLLSGEVRDGETRLRETVPAEQFRKLAWEKTVVAPAPDTDTVEQVAALAKLLDARIANAPADWRPAVEVHLPSDYLQAVALLAAVDLIWDNLHAAQFGGITAVPTLYLHAAVRPTAVTDTPEAYLVDATVRAVAAASAGVDALSVAPFSASPDHRRQARNLLHLLQLEAGLAGGTDALAGAAWFEEAALAIARAARPASPAD